MAVDVHQLLYRRPTLHKWTSISFSMNVLHDIRGRPRVSIWTYNMWPWTSTSYYMDVQSYIRGRPPVSIWTYNLTSVDVHHLLYERTTFHKWISISFFMDVRHYIHGRRPVSIWTFNVWSWTSMDSIPLCAYKIT